MTARTILAAALAGGMLLSSASAEEAPPAEAFAWLPTLSQVRISPDGSKFTAMLNLDENYQLGIFEMDGQKMVPLHMIEGSEESKAIDPFWANDERVVFSLLLSQEAYGTRIHATRLLSIKPDGTDTVYLFGRAEHSPRYQSDIVSILPDDPDHILIQYGVYNRAYRVPVGRPGRHDRVQTYHDGIADWMADVHGTIRVGSGVSWGKHHKLIVRLEDGEWKDISHRVADDDYTFYVEGVSDEPNIFYVLSDIGGDTEALYAYNALTDTLGPPIFRTEFSDVYGVVQDRNNGRAIGVVYADDEGRIYWLEDSFIRREIDKLEEVFPGKRVSITSLNQPESHAVLFVDGGSDPGQYFLYDIADKRVKGLPVQYPDLLDYSLGEVISTSYRARDGLDIPAYITLPPGYNSLEEASALPFVLLPHGGPTSRNYLGFDYRAQFLATRGYGVMQMNFRGSAGYGNAFRQAGERQWGQAMQDDITDGALWLIGAGIAEPERIAIMGGSYGGYAALMGVVRTSTLYQCAVSFAGVTDLPKLIRDQGPGRAAKRSTRHIGTLWRDRDMLWDNSPLAHAGNITRPVLLIHGDLDGVVDVDHSRKLVRQMERAGRPVRYVEQAGGDHHLSRYGDRLQYLQETERFLAGCLGPGAR